MVGMMAPSVRVRRDASARAAEAMPYGRRDELLGVSARAEGLTEEAARKLEEKGISVALINPRWIKPIDTGALLRVLGRFRTADRALGEVELDLAQRLFDVGRVHLVAALVALEAATRPDRIAERPVEG